MFDRQCSMPLYVSTAAQFGVLHFLAKTAWLKEYIEIHVNILVCTRLEVTIIVEVWITSEDLMTVVASN